LDRRNYIYSRDIRSCPPFAATLRGVALRAFSLINYFFFIGLIILLGSTCWNFCYGLDTGNVERHDQGSKTKPGIGSNLALLLKKLKKSWKYAISRSSICPSSKSVLDGLNFPLYCASTQRTFKVDEMQELISALLQRKGIGNECL